VVIDVAVLKEIKNAMVTLGSCPTPLG